ncbi:MAG: S-methyl-5-thioribose-1-phosphate isomerase, partial [Planctomicrobium sp.]|nr:S-methyl-5-thioribose-1-phosphate isomerase [Planctomicrobium sp.]
MTETTTPPRTMRWNGGPDGSLTMIDQTLLPVEFKEINCRTVEEVWEAIKMLRVRGAPAIGCAAAYGVIIGVQGEGVSADRQAFNAKLKQVTDYLAESRPTAVNLFWALDRMKAVAQENSSFSPNE